jgi:hypothetical protein
VKSYFGQLESNLAQLYSRLANISMLLAILSSVVEEPNEQVVTVTLETIDVVTNILVWWE